MKPAQSGAKRTADGIASRNEANTKPATKATAPAAYHLGSIISSGN